MITGPTWFGVKAAKDYHQEDDYHSGETHAEAPNALGGKLAERLGLGNWTAEKYGQALRGELAGLEFAMKPSVERAACDFTASAPKSVSIAALVLGKDDVARAHERAVSRVAEYLAEHACYRITEGGVTRTERAEEALYSKFTHATSRKRDSKKGVGPGGDPQLHTHILMLNYVRCKDGKVRALENQEMVRARMSAGAAYRAALAKELQAAGYKINLNGEAFEIAGISKELIDHFSTGRKSIIEAAKEAGIDPERMSARQRDLLNKAERDSKLKLDRAGLRRFWSDRAAAIGHQLEDVKLQHLTAAQLASLPRRPTALEAVELAISARTERSSTIRHDYDLIQTAIHESGYSVDVEDVRRAIAFKRSVGELVVVDEARGTMTTRERLANERAIDALYERGLGEVEPMGTKDQAIDELNAMEARMSARTGAPVRLTDGQRHAVIEATITRNRVLVWEGDAGVGKSTSMEAVLALAKQNRMKVRGLGPHGKAVDALKESGLEAWTSQKAFASEKWWEGVDGRTVIVIDEFGKVDAASARVILERAEERGARVIVSGDTKQWAAVEAGSPAHQLYVQAQQSGDLVKLDQMMRARTEQGRQLHNMARDDTDASVLLAFEQGRVRAFEKANQRYEYIGREFAKLTPQEQEKALVISGMNRDREAINAAVRRNLKLQPGIEVVTYSDKKLERAKLRNHSNYEINDVLRFAVADGRFQRGESVRIVSNDEGILVVERKHGQRATVKVEDVCDRVSLGASEKIEVSQGELIQFTAPIEKLGVITKESGRIERLDHDTRMAEVRLLASGRVVSVELREFGTAIRHGYCQTSDGAQGATGKGKVWLHMASDDPTVNKNAWYTNVTRMTSHVEIVTDMKEGGRITAMQEKVSKALKADFADPTRKPADSSVVKIDFKAPDRVWANVGHENVRFTKDSSDADIVRALVESRERLGSKWHATGSADFQRRVARLAGMSDELAGVSFRNPKLNEEAAKSRQQLEQRLAAERAASVERVAVNAPAAARPSAEQAVQRPEVQAPDAMAKPHVQPDVPRPQVQRPDVGERKPAADGAGSSHRPRSGR